MIFTNLFNVPNTSQNIIQLFANILIAIRCYSKNPQVNIMF